MFFWYKLLSYLFYPFAYFFLYLRKFKKKEHKTRYKEKLSHIETRRGDGRLIWFHVASVGEAMSILPLVDFLKKEKEINKILITTITLSSSQILDKRFEQDEKIIHQFLPLDVPIFVSKFLSHWRPNLAIFIDSEIWPNLITDIKKKKVPLLLINGRITKKSFLRWNFFNSFAKKIFGKFDLCIAANKQSENYLKILGAKNTKNYGNLKFAKSKTANGRQLNSSLLSKIESRKIWCASSTHYNEEILCGKTHLELKKIYKNMLTIIIPRHVNRVGKIKDQLAKYNLSVCLYKDSDKITESTDVLLIDAYGESTKFYKIVKCVLLGKSLVESLKSDSGQNPIEASIFGCQVIHGPYVSNFSEVYEYLQSLNVAKKVNDIEELKDQLVEQLKTDKVINSEVIKKIEYYGETTLNNVLNEIKIYISK